MARSVVEVLFKLKRQESRRWVRRDERPQTAYQRQLAIMRLAGVTNRRGFI